MAEVYEVEHSTLGVRRAMKVFNAEGDRAELLRSRFLAEGRLLARLDHPRLVKVYDSDEDKVNNDLVIVFENKNGATASDQVVVARMKQIMLPSFSVKPPATLKDAVGFLRKASKDYDPRKDGVDIILKTAKGESVPAVPKISATDLSVYDALDLVTGAVGYGFAAEK